MEITDRKLWERELTDHMRWHAADLHDSPHAGAHGGVKPDGVKPGVWFSAPLLALWSGTVMVLTSAGWVIGLYFI